MLERFKVPKEDQVRVSEESLRRTVAEFFQKMGETAQDAATAADTLVMTDLRGVESHGVSNMVRRYMEYYADGRVKARPNWRIVRETKGTANIDADKGLVIILGQTAMQMAVDKAKEVGVGVVTISNSGHSGAIGHHAMLAAKQDMVGIVMTAAGLHVVPTFGAEGRFGTNPIALAAPANKEAPFLFDAATSSVAMNKVWLAGRVGADLTPGMIADKEGNPIMEEVLPPPTGEFFLLPMGATRELGSHKGYGLAMMGEILAALLSGDVPNMLDGRLTSKHHFAAYSIAAFTDLDQFKDTMDRTLKSLKDTKPAPGHERVLYPGLTEYEDEQDRRANGIPLHREVVEWFENMAGEFAIPGLERV